MEIRGNKVIIKLKQDSHVEGILVEHERKFSKPTRGVIVYKGDKVEDMEVGDTVLFEKHLPTKWTDGLYMLKDIHVKAVIK